VITPIIVALARKWWPHMLAAALALMAWHFHARAVANARALRDQAAAYQQAQIEAQRQALEALHHQEAAYRAAAERSDNAYQTELAGARAAADGYIAAHRVRPAPAQSAASPTPASAQGDGSNLPPLLPASGVVVSDMDVHACTDAVTYARAAHDWAMGLAQSSSNP
jgi:type II secretory pathway pseudopilin PulG